MQEDLIKLGLTKNEARVYLSLLSIGETSVGNIINDLKFHRQIIYNALDSLEKKNMVIRSQRNEINHYKIADPKLIIENIIKKELIAKRLSENIEQEIKKTKKEHEINIYEKQETIQNFYIQKYKKMTKRGTFYVLSSLPEDFINLVGKDFFYDEYAKIRDTKKIKSKHIGIEKNREIFKSIKKEVGFIKREIRYVSNEILGPISLNIFDDSVVFINSKKEKFIIEIKNKEIRDSYKEHFDMLWKIAKK